MRKLALAALLAALATPAWAYNGGNPKAFFVCTGSGTLPAICGMKHASEDDALTMAQAQLAICSPDQPHKGENWDAECLVIRAYIKQRWGH